MTGAAEFFLLSKSNPADDRQDIAAITPTGKPRLSPPTVQERPFLSWALSHWDHWLHRKGLGPLRQALEFLGCFLSYDEGGLCCLSSSFSFPTAYPFSGLERSKAQGCPRLVVVICRSDMRSSDMRCIDKRRSDLRSSDLLWLLCRSAADGGLQGHLPAARHTRCSG